MKIKDIQKQLLEESEKTEIPMSKRLINTKIEKKTEPENNFEYNKFFKLLPIFAPIIICVLIFSVYFSVVSFSKTKTTELTSYILKINPEFCITTNSNNKVVNVCSLNDDADDVLDNADFDNIVGTNFNDCVLLIINNIDNSIFQNYGNKRISLYALNDNRDLIDSKLDEFGDIVRQGLDDRGYNNIEFDKFDMSFDFFRNEMGITGEFNGLDEMQFFIENHDKFYNKNHPMPPR